MRSTAIKTLRPFRAPLFYARQPFLQPRGLQPRRLQSTIQLPNGETARRREVRFTSPPFFSWRRVMTLCLYSVSVYYTLKYVTRLAGFDVSIELADEEEESPKDKQDTPGQGVEVTDEDLEAAEDSLFIPMTWAKKLPRQLYKGTDPEWQAFLSVVKVKDAHKAIWAKLLTSFQSFAAATPQIARQLGGDIKLGRHWLDMTFPDGPPQEYIRGGLEFGDGYVAWSQQRITNETQGRLERALWPKAIFNSVWATTKAVANMEWQRISHSLGLSDENSFDREFQAAAAMMRRAKTLQNVQTPAVEAGAANKDAHKALWPLPALNLAQGGSVDDMSKLKFAMAAHVFSRTLYKDWNPKTIEPPKGTFVVHGIVELRGKNGRMLFDIYGIYDPKQGVYRSIQGSPRYFKKWKQSPAGR